MPSTCLQLIQNSMSESGLGTTTFAVNNPNEIVVQQLALLNALGNELQRQFIWQHSTVPYMFTVNVLETTGNTVNGSNVVTGIPDTSTLSTLYQVSGPGINVNVAIRSVDSPTQITLDQPCTATGTGVTLNFGQTKYVLPSDYDRPVDRTHWDVSKHWELLGPATAQQWEYLQRGWIATGPRAVFRLLGGYFQIWPIQTTNDLMGFEYISRNWANTTGVFAPDKSSFTADTDTCCFPDRLMVVGLKKKYYEAKGFDTAALDKDYQQQLGIAFGADQGSATLSMSQRPTSQLITWANIPDSNYGVQS